MKHIVTLLFLLSSAASAVNLFGTSWQLTSVNKAAVNDKLAPMTLRIDGERFRGNTGCNNYFGNLVTNSTFSNVKSTALNCTPDLVPRAKDFLKMLDDAKVDAKSTDKLLILQSKQGTLTFKSM